MPASNSYWILKVQNIPIDNEEIISQWLWDIGATGLHEDLSFEKKKDGYLPDLLKKDHLHINAYFSEPLEEGQWAEIQSRFPMISVALEEAPNQDWNQQWKDQWKPFVLCDGFEIFPSWWEDKTPMEKRTRFILDIEPGMAFGTGTHETTKLCAQIITDFSKHGLSADKIENILDLGTGTGILSIVLDRLNFSKIKGNDVDPECRRVFLENLEKNRTQSVEWCQDWLEAGPYDLLIANIIDGVLLDLAEPIVSVLKPNSYVLFSGILTERRENFVNEMGKSFSFDIISEKTLGEWSAVLLKVKK